MTPSPRSTRTSLALALLACFTAVAVGAEIPTEIVSATPVTNGNFGIAVAGAGDLNGNGHDDLVIGAPLEDGGVGYVGRILVQDGGTGATILNLAPPQFWGSRWGTTVGSGDDLDGDGVNDIVAGSLSERALAFDGATGDTLFSMHHPDGEFDTSFGVVVAMAGDFDHDGLGDVIVGAYNQEIDGLLRAGRAYVFAGPDGALIATLESPFMEDSGQFGIAVAAAGDVNDDGWDDVIVGAFIETVNGVNDAGRAYVFSGATQDTLFTLQASVPDLAAEFGNSVAGIGDINGDDHAEVIVGALQDGTPEVYDSGRAYIFDGATGALIHDLSSPTPDFSGFMGKAVAGIGDYDGDGTNDVVVTAHTEDANGTNGSGRAHVFSGATGEHLDTFESPNTENFGRFGVAAAGAGDVNGDGRPDVIIGAGLEAVDGLNDAGRAYVFPAPPVIAAPDVPGSRDVVLEQNHPNPFNPRTRVSFDLPRATHAKLTVHDLRGRRVATLADARYDAGRHVFTWHGTDDDGRAMPSGSYLLRLSTESAVRTAKAVLVR